MAGIIQGRDVEIDSRPASGGDVVSDWSDVPLSGRAK